MYFNELFQLCNEFRKYLLNMKIDMTYENSLIWKDIKEHDDRTFLIHHEQRTDAGH